MGDLADGTGRSGVPRRLSRRGGFLTSARNVAEKPVKSAVNMVTHPKETVQGLPAGVGRFFDRVSQAALFLMASHRQPFRAARGDHTTRNVAATSASPERYVPSAPTKRSGCGRSRLGERSIPAACR